MNVALPMIINISLFAEHNATISQENNNTYQAPIEITTVRSVQGASETPMHAQGQIRMGYITTKEELSQRKSAYAMGGHFHFDTDRWKGLKIGASAYTVLNLGINQNPIHLNPGFFDANGKSFVLLSKAFIEGEWGHTAIKAGRQTLDNPMIDSDDIRMVPNFFQAYTVTNTDITNLTLTAGFIDRMAGWENSIDASKFVNIGEALGTQRTDGVYYAGIAYDDIQNLSLNLWYYHYDDIANVTYAEAGYNHIHINDTVDMTIGLQFAATRETGKKLLGRKNGESYGLSVEAAFSNGITLLTAYNGGFGETGAVDISLGGGPFFTSMEDQTIDAIGGKGDAWMGAISYDFSRIDIKSLSGGFAYGSFRSDRDIGHYHATETDVIFNYMIHATLNITAALALVNHKGDGIDDLQQFRVIGNYDF